MNLIDMIRCKHRHTIDEHPQCFARGEVIDNRPPELQRKQPWYMSADEMRIGYLDIESDGLKTDFSTVLSWCIKERDGKVTSDIITKKELFNTDDDKPDRRLIKSVCDELRKYKIVVSYYGTGFDFPTLRLKALRYGYDFPGYGDLYHYDLYYTVKSKFASLSRKSLAVVTDYLDIPGKTPLDRRTWRLAKYGDKEALAEVLEHNVGDVEILEELHKKLEPFQKWTKKSI